MSDYEIVYSTPAHTLEIGDQAIIDGDQCIVLTVDDNRDDIDEIFVKVDNLSGGMDEFELYADDELDIWGV